MKTKVIFRKLKDGQIVAIFPEIQADENRGHCMSYIHIGQHGACSYELIRFTEPATPIEYGPLLNELVKIGYDPEVGKQISKRWFEILPQPVDYLWTSKEDMLSVLLRNL